MSSKKAPKSSPGTAPGHGLSPLTGKQIAGKQIAGKQIAGKAVHSKQSTRTPPRRTQSERLAETRSRILAATTTYIDGHGYHQTSLQRVASAAGVTVGAVQHHFASKTELLTAVVEDNFQQLASLLGDVAFEGAPLAERIRLFVNHSWEFCNSPKYQSSLQILLGMRQETSDNFEDWLNNTLGHVVKHGFDLWLRIFRDIKLTETEHFDIMLYSFSSLSGTALMSRITRMPERVDSDLRELEKMLLSRFKQR